MARKPKTIPGPSRLSKIMENLVRAPRPYMSTLKALKMTYAPKNDNFGARHFARNDLPRIRYANPNIEIQVNKVPKSVGDTWRPEMQLEFRDGTTKTVDMTDKWSTTIFQDVMELAGGSNWERWKRERKAAGLPILDLAPAKPTIEKTVSDYSDLFNRPDRPKTGAAAVLP